MSEFFFGTGRGVVPPSVQRDASRIARSHGAALTCVTLPGEGPRFWFSTPNRGFPFDAAIAKAVTAELDAAGLMHEGRLRTKVRRPR